MSMKNCRRLSACLAVLTIVCGGTCKLFGGLLPRGAVMGLSICAILFACATVFVIIRYHRCPHCGRFIPITLRPKLCLHCEHPLN